MRYYKIVVGAETGVQPGGQPASGNPGMTWSNQVNGQYDPGALEVEFDIPVAPLAQPAGQASVKLWGVPLSSILPGAGPGSLSAAAQFNGAPISVYGGMQKGLPLVDPTQAGLLVKGMVLQAYGNWQGINQSLDFVISTDGGLTQSAPGNISFTWPKGSELSDMVQQVLAQALPGVPVVMKVTTGLVLPKDEPGIYQTLEQFSSFVKSVSQEIMPGGDYPGVDIAFSMGGQVVVSDGTQGSGGAGKVTALRFEDLIGQPTWLGPFQMQFATVLRGDLGFDSIVTFPPLAAYQTTTSAQSNSFARTPQTFTGQWRILFPRHIGKSRAGDATAWVSTYQAVAVPSNEPQADSSAQDVSS